MNIDGVLLLEDVGLLEHPLEIEKRASAEVRGGVDELDSPVHLADGEVMLWTHPIYRATLS